MADLAITPLLPIDVTESRIIASIPGAGVNHWLPHLLALYAQIYRCWPEKPRKATGADWVDGMEMWNNWRYSTNNPWEYAPVATRRQFSSRRSVLRTSALNNGGTKAMISQVQELVRVRKEELETARAQLETAAGAEPETAGE